MPRPDPPEPPNPSRPRPLYRDAALLGAVGGLLLLVLLLRLNPTLDPSPTAVVGAALIWCAWGVPTVGLLLYGIGLVARRLRPPAERARSWPTPELAFLLFLTAAIVSRINADLHPEFLPGNVHKTLGQDAVGWLIAGLLVLGAGVRMRRAGRRGLAVVAALAFGLPLVRLALEPTPSRDAELIAARPLGTPERPLVVIGVEGLDASVLLHAAGSRRYPTLDGLLDGGAWGPVDAYRPFLRQSLWTTLATGTYPRRHGLTSRWRWEMPWPDGIAFQLLPWTPIGSGWVLPVGLARRRQPEPAAVPPLWERLRESGIATPAWDWPGSWQPGSVERRTAWPTAATVLDPVLVDSLDAVLEPFPELRGGVLRAVEGDVGRLAAASEVIAGGAGSAWVHLRTVGEMRRGFEPLSLLDSRERAVWDLLLELVDDRLGALVQGLPPGTLVAVVSPFGYSPPGSFESLRRLLGIGGRWRMSATGSPDGVLVLNGEGVVPGHRVERAQLADVAPTLCYLTGLPVAQYMEGRVMLDAIDPAYLAAHPLQVVD